MVLRLKGDGMLSLKCRSQSNDFHVFICLKYVASSRFVADDEMKEAVTSWLQTLDTDFYYKGIQALVPLWVKLNIKFTLEQTTKAQRGARSAAQHIY
jgi:hypothetical protein